MPRKTPSKAKHTGLTAGGNTRDQKIERVRDVTIYKRGKVYWLYYRENGKTIRKRVEGNLATARAWASQVAAALDEHRPSPLTFERISPRLLVDAYLDYTRDVQQLALRTQDRYRAALQCFLDFVDAKGIGKIDLVDEGKVQEFVQWMRKKKRGRNGSAASKQEGYRTGGIKFVLSTCRTAFNWAAKRRHLPPYAVNPFSSFPIDRLRDRSDRGDIKLMRPKEGEAFFAACDDWQRPIFSVLAVYGMRVGELTHLLVEDVDFEGGFIHIHSKPKLFWFVKTGRERVLPLFEDVTPIIERAIGGRRAGFVFRSRGFADQEKRPATLSGPKAFDARLTKSLEECRKANPEAGDRELQKTATGFSRAWGQIPEKRVRQEYMKITAAIGRPDLTRVHDLRHLFASRSQELGLNPILVQEMLGHSSLEMTRRYSHLGLDAKREALRRIVGGILPRGAP